MKNLNELSVKWNEQKSKLKQKYVMVTERDTLLVQGKYDGLLDRLQVKLGKTKAHIHKILTEF